MRRVAWLVVLALALLSVWWWLTPTQEPALPAATPTARIDEPALPAAQPEPLAAQRATVALAPAPQRWLRVIDALSGLPEARARVYWLPEARAARELDARRFEHGLDSAEVWPEVGTALELDAAARGLLPPAADGAVRVGALSSRGFAELTLAADAASATDLLLRREFALEIRVVDRAGRAQAGVPLALVDLRTQATELEGESDADGSARFRFNTQWLLDRAGPFRLGIALPFAPAVAIDFERAHVPAGPLTLVLPEHGRLAVRCRVAAGLEPLVAVDEAGPQLELRLASLDTPLSEFQQPSTRGWEQAFEHVPAGIPFQVQATLRGFDALRAQVEPLAAGEVREIELRFDAAQAVVIARLVDAERSPYRDTGFEIQSRDRSRNTSSEQRRTERSDGGGYVRLKQRELDPGAARELVIRLPGTALQAEVGLPAPLPRVVDLGDLVLELPPLVAAGRVVDDGGKSIAGARVKALVSRSPGTWTALAGCDAHSDADGRFELRGRCDARELRVSAMAEGLHHFTQLDAAPVQVGATDVVVVLEGRSSIAGRIVLPAGVPPDSCSVSVQRLQGPERRMGVTVGPDGRFSETAVVPSGPARLLVCIGPSAQPFHVVDDLLLPAGATLSDPRLDPLDLSSAFDVARFEVVDELGNPLPATLRALDPAEDDWTSRGWTLRAADGRVACPRIQACAHVLVTSDGYRSLALELAAAPERVVLERGLRVDLSVPTFDAPAGTQLQVQPKQGLVYCPRFAIAPGATHAWLAPADGVWEFEFHLQVPGGNYGDFLPLDARPRSIVLAGAGPHAHAIEFDRDELRRLLEPYER